MMAPAERDRIALEVVDYMREENHKMAAINRTVAG